MLQSLIEMVQKLMFQSLGLVQFSKRVFVTMRGGKMVVHMEVEK